MRREGGLGLLKVSGAGGGEELVFGVSGGVGGSIGLENHLFNSKFINDNKLSVKRGQSTIFNEAGRQDCHCRGSVVSIKDLEG